MKLILIVLILAQIYGAFSTNNVFKQRRGLIGIQNPETFSIAQDIYTSLAAISNAVTNAISNVKVWTRNRHDDRLRLLVELETFQLDLEQSKKMTSQGIADGTLAIQYRAKLAEINLFLQSHMDELNILLTILIPTMEDSIASDAITSSLEVVKVTRTAMEKFHHLISS